MWKPLDQLQSQLGPLCKCNQRLFAKNKFKVQRMDCVCGGSRGEKAKGNFDKKKNVQEQLLRQHTDGRCPALKLHCLSLSINNNRFSQLKPAEFCSINESSLANLESKQINVFFF